jgi:threonyl-tRNA synthetase
MIHRAPFGSIERITAIILEHTCGKLPFWLSPEQIIILPISEKVLDYSKNIFEKLKKENFRVIMDDRNEKLGKKILEAEKMKIPFFIIIGKNEVKENILTVRKCGENFDNKLTFETFLTEIKMLD